MKVNIYATHLYLFSGTCIVIVVFIYSYFFSLFFRTECFSLWYSKTLNYGQLASVESYTKIRWICIKILLLNCCLIRHTTQHIRNWIAFTIYDELNLFDLLKIHFYWGENVYIQDLDKLVFFVSNDDYFRFLNIFKQKNQKYQCLMVSSGSIIL